MEFTGERMIPEKNRKDGIYLEHMSRYFFASQFVKGKKVLDIACGSGYGSKLLSETGADFVFGIDISQESINYAKEKYSGKKINFIRGSVEKIPIEDNSIDVIVSMETIEHIEGAVQEKFIQESKRVLKKDGIFIASTPNKLVYPKGNPFHIKEFDQREFASFLQKAFVNVLLFYQDNVGCNYIMDEKTLEKEIISDDAYLRTRKISHLDSAGSMYLLAVCTNSKLELKIKNFVTIFNDKIYDYHNIIKEKDAEIKKT